MLRLIVAVLRLAERVSAGDVDAAREAEELAAKVGGSGLWQTHESPSPSIRPRA